MIAVAGFLLAAAGAGLWWRLLDRPGDEALAATVRPGVPAGLALVLAVAAVQAGFAAAVVAGWGRAAQGGFSRTTVLTAVLGFGLLGLVGDLGPTSTAMRRALLVGQALVAAVVVAPLAEGTGRLVLHAALVVSAAQVARLLDRGGRLAAVVAIGVLAGLVPVAAATPGTSPPAMAGPALAVGGATGILVLAGGLRVAVSELGASALGAAAGLAVILTGSRLAATLGLAVALVALAGLSRWGGER